MSKTIITPTPDPRLAAFGRVNSVMDMIWSGTRLDRVDRGLQAIVNDDDFVINPKVTVVGGEKVYHITSDSNVRSATAAIEALNCASRYGLALAPAKIPMALQPVDCKARLVPLGKVMTTEQIYNLPSLVSPAQYFAFGAKFQKAQMDGPIIAVWLGPGGQFWYALLDHLGGEPDVTVNQVDPDDGWDSHYRVLLCK